MNLFDYDKEIECLIDEETGEIANAEKFESLCMEREQKLENLGLWVKDLTAEAEALRNEEKALADRRKRAERKVESIKKYLEGYLAGNKFSTAKVAYSFRKSKKVELTDETMFMVWAEENNRDLIKVKSEPSLTAIKEAIESGAEVPYASVVEKENLQIK